MRWNESVTLQFVKIYLKHECLWNPGHPGYKVKYQRDKAYGDICTEFKLATMKALSVPEVKIKIKNLRTTYAQQVNKILQKSRPDSIYEPSIIWFHEMDNCMKHIPSNRHTASYISGSQQAPEVDSSSQIWVDQEKQKHMEESNPDPLNSNSDTEYDSSKQDYSSSHIKKEREQSSPSYRKIKKKKLKRQLLDHDYLTDSTSESTITEDEFDIYGKYIASQLRKMDLHKALRLQLEIQSLVSEARISDVTTDE